MPRLLTITAGAAILAALLAIGWAVAQPPGNAAADSPARRHTELHVRYAEARLRLAELRLRKAEQLNATSPHQVTETEMRRLRGRVEHLRSAVAETRNAPHGYGIAAQRAAARATVRLAEQDLAEARAVAGRQPGAIGPFDLQAREAWLEIARLRAEIWDDPAFLASPTDVLQMQIDQLADQVQDLQRHASDAPALDRF